MRGFIGICVVAASVIVSVAGQPALAATKKQTAACEEQGAIVTQATDLRLARKSKRKAIKMMTKGEAAVAENYIPIVPQMVEWIYSLERDALVPDPAVSYLKACLDQ